MDDSLTQLVLDCQAGKVPVKRVEDEILLVVFDHLKGFRRNHEDEVSGFLLDFYPKIGGLIRRFRARGLPFRHYLFRTVRWQWTSWRSQNEVAVTCERLPSDPLVWDLPEETSAQEGCELRESRCEPDAVRRKRLLLLTLKAGPFLQETDVSRLAELTGTDEVWLNGALKEMKASAQPRVDRDKRLTERRSDLFWQRLVAEDRAFREPEPARRVLWDERARQVRGRLDRLSEEKKSLQVAPSHFDLARMLGLPKGTVDSGIYHLKKELSTLYTGEHEPDFAPGDEQPAQKKRTRNVAAKRRPSPAP